MHRKGYDMNEEHTKQFSDVLQSKNIFFPLPKKKDNIKGFLIPLADR